MSDFGKVEIARLSFLISCTRGPPYAWLQPTFRRTGLAPGHPDELVPPTIQPRTQAAPRLVLSDGSIRLSASSDPWTVRVRQLDRARLTQPNARAGTLGGTFGLAAWHPRPDSRSCAQRRDRNGGAVLPGSRPAADRTGVL